VRKAIPWVGGKAALAKTIVPLLPEHICYCEPFAGGAAVFFAKERSRVEVLNDKNLGLVNLLRVFQRHPEAFLKELDLVVSSREWFEVCWAQPGLTDVERAARFWYRLKNCFGSQPASHSFGTHTVGTRGINPEVLREDVQAVHRRLNRVILENLDWQAVLARYDRPHTCFYCDPPYFRVKASYGPGMDLTDEDHGRLAKGLRGIRGKAILSINDHPEIRRLYAWAPVVRQIKVRYTLGLNNRTHTHKRRTFGELLVFTFTPAA